MDEIMKTLTAFSTLVIVKPNMTGCKVVAKTAAGEDYLQDEVTLTDPVLFEENEFLIPVHFFTDILYAYVECKEDGIRIEKCGITVWAEPVKNRNYIRGLDILKQLNLIHWTEERTLYIVVETKNAGLRELTGREKQLSYAKYYNEYWETPFYLRKDVLAWSKKAHLYQLSGMADYHRLLHIKDVRNLLDPEFREQKWHEGWTLFPDGSGVTCVKTEFPGVTCEAFQWWFAWHVKEDLRYMLWFPPAHYGISPSYELRKKLADKSKTVFEKTHGGDTVHLVYESTQIDAMSCMAARPIEWHSIAFHDPQKRGFLDEDLEVMKKNKCVAICGGTRMLHFFAENMDGSGGTLYTHFWFGYHLDENGAWVGGKTAQDPSIIQPILNISQHAVKEFAQLAHILPRIYKEEGSYEKE